jgi:hypothetical protein
MSASGSGASRTSPRGRVASLVVTWVGAGGTADLAGKRDVGGQHHLGRISAKALGFGRIQIDEAGAEANLGVFVTDGTLTASGAPRCFSRTTCESAAASDASAR